MRGSSQTRRIDGWIHWISLPVWRIFEKGVEGPTSRIADQLKKKENEESPPRGEPSQIRLRREWEKEEDYPKEFDQTLWKREEDYLKGFDQTNPAAEWKAKGSMIKREFRRNTEEFAEKYNGDSGNAKRKSVSGDAMTRTRTRKNAALTVQRREGGYLVKRRRSKHRWPRRRDRTKDQTTTARSKKAESRETEGEKPGRPRQFDFMAVKRSPSEGKTPLQLESRPKVIPSPMSLSAFIKPSHYG